jgi:general secretion pathway protein F
MRYRSLSLDAAGVPVEQFLDAGDENSVVRLLRAQGLTPIAISRSSASFMEFLLQPRSFGGGFKRRDLTGLTTRLAMLLKAGLPVSQALELEQGSAQTRGTAAFASRLLARIKEGQSLADGLAQENAVPGFYAGVVRAAEKGGRLQQGLEDLGQSLTEADKTRDGLVTALTYPLLVIASTVAALIFVLVYVIPNFASLFEGETARLPWMTRGVLWLSEVVTSHGLKIVLALILAGFAMRWLKSQPVVDHWWQQRITARSPVASLMRTYLNGRWLRIAGTQIINGVRLPDALEATAHAIGAKPYADLLRQSALGLREGRALSAELADAPLILPAATRLIAVGEQGGTMGQMMLQAATLFENDARQRLERLVAVANPLAIIVLGGLVATMIASVMIGIFSITDLAAGR